MCAIELILTELETHAVDLVPGWVKLETSRKLTQYRILDDPPSPTLVNISPGMISEMLNRTVMLFRQSRRWHQVKTGIQKGAYE